MNKKEYKKSYKLFMAWMVGYILLLFLMTRFIENLSTKLSTLLILLTTVFGLYLATLIIYKTEYIYWFTGGPSYKEAKAMGSEKRKEYARIYLNKFAKTLLVSVFYGIFSFLLKLSTWIDVIIITIFIIISTFSTEIFKFKKYKKKF